MTVAKKKKPLIMWQKPMTWVLYSLIPVVAASIYFFGWQSLIMLALCNGASFFIEYLFLRKQGQPVSSAIFVTGTLLALALPPTLPYWMGVVGAVVGTTFGKMVFGGFGKNVFNPALVGRAFIYVCFPAHMTAFWFPPLTQGSAGLTAYKPAVDTITAATPLTIQVKDGLTIAWKKLFMGCTAGSYGETCALLIILGGIFIVWKKAANWRFVVGGLLGFLLFQTIFWQMGIERAIPPHYALFSGSFIFGLFYFITEPISGPMNDEAKWIYSFFIGAMTVVIRVFSAWPEGVMFAVLLGNMYGPIVDFGVKEYKTAQKKKAKAAA